MRPTTRLFIVVVSAWLAAACGSDAAPAGVVGEGADAGLSEPAAPPPVPLADAIERGLTSILRVELAGGESHRMRLLLAPNVDEPTILIEPGIVFEGTGRAGKRYVAALPVEQPLYRKSPRGIDVPVVSLDPKVLRDREYRITAMGGGGPLVSLLDATAARASPPDWSVVQVAAWVLAKDVDLESVRDARYMSNRLSHHVVIMGEQRRVAPSVETIDEARRLLAEAGFATGSARLFAEAEAALQDGLAATWEPRRALQALDQLDFFRSRGTVERLALRVLGDARGPDWEGGGAERRAAAQLLGHRLLDVMDDEVERERLVTVLREARAREFEPKVLSEIDGSLRLAERAADKS